MAREIPIDLLSLNGRLWLSTTKVIGGRAKWDKFQLGWGGQHGFSLGEPWSLSQFLPESKAAEAEPKMGSEGG